MHIGDVAGESGGTETRGLKRREEREKKVGGDLEWRNAMGKEALRDSQGMPEASSDVM